MKTRKYYLIKLQDDLYRFAFRMDIESIILETIIIEPYYPYYEIIGIVESDYTTMKPIYEALNNYKKGTFYGECEEVINFFLNNRTNETIELIQSIRTANIPEGILTRAEVVSKLKGLYKSYGLDKIINIGNGNQQI